MIVAILTVLGLSSLVYSAAILRAFSTEPVTALSLFVTLACFVGFGVRRTQLRVILIGAAIFALSLGLASWLEIMTLVIVLIIEHALRTGLFLRRRYSELLTMLGSWSIGFALVTIVRLLSGVTSVSEEPRRWLVANVWLLLVLTVIVLATKRVTQNFYRPTL